MIFLETHLPERLKQLRGKQSQASFAQSIGVKQQTYSNWETGRSDIPLGWVAGLSQYFGVTTDWLLGLDDSRNSVSLTATDHSVAANNSTVAADAQEVQRLLGIIESQQRVIEKITGATR